MQRQKKRKAAITTCIIGEKKKVKYKPFHEWAYTSASLLLIPYFGMFNCNGNLSTVWKNDTTINT